MHTRQKFSCTLVVVLDERCFCVYFIGSGQGSTAVAAIDRSRSIDRLVVCLLFGSKDLFGSMRGVIALFVFPNLSASSISKETDPPKTSITVQYCTVQYSRLKFNGQDNRPTQYLIKYWTMDSSKTPCNAQNNENGHFDVNSETIAISKKRPRNSRTVSPCRKCNGIG